MKINELIIEAKMDPGIKELYLSRGYKFVDSGQDMDVYLAPDGTILKIFGYERDSEPTPSKAGQEVVLDTPIDYSKLSKGQRSFFDFVEFCKNNEDNQFLPQFGKLEEFTFNGRKYLRIKCERLFEFTDAKVDELGYYIEIFSEYIVLAGPERGLEHIENEIADEDETRRSKMFGTIITLLGGEEEVKLFADTIYKLKKLAESKGYTFDLHAGNFMVTSEGDIVINDPFFTGTMRSRV